MYKEKDPSLRIGISNKLGHRFSGLCSPKLIVVSEEKIRELVEKAFASDAPSFQDSDREVFGSSVVILHVSKPKKN